MGEVYRALDTGLNRPVALKVLRADFAEDERFRERLLRESRLAASLDHPNVIPIYEAGEQAGRLFIAMRFVAGEDLKALLRRLEDVGGSLRRRVVPDAVDQPLDRDRLVRLREEDREDRPLPLPSERDLRAVHERLEWTQDPEFDPHPLNLPSPGRRS